MYDSMSSKKKAVHCQSTFNVVICSNYMRADITCIEG